MHSYFIWVLTYFQILRWPHQAATNHPTFHAHFFVSDAAWKFHMELTWITLNNQKFKIDIIQTP